MLTPLPATDHRREDMYVATTIDQPDDHLPPMQRERPSRKIPTVVNEAPRGYDEKHWST